jgi:UMF1 family MFS transporter
MKKVKLWYLYDFANSFASVVLLFYYPLILSDRGASDAWIGVSASIATGILLLVLPYLGAYSDRTGKRIQLIRIGSIVMVISLLAISFITSRNGQFEVSILVSLSFLYVLFQVCFQGSYSLYSAMLRNITDSSRSVKVSGFGYGIGQLGNAIAILIIGAIIGTQVIMIGLSDKSLAIFLGALFFFAISILFLRQKDSENKKISTFSYKKFFKKIFKNKRVFLFLIGYSLLADATLTFQLYLAIYVRKIFGFSDHLVSYVVFIGLVFGVLGAFFANKLVKKINNVNKTLRWASILYGINFGLCAIIPPVPALVFIVLAMSGIGFGLFFSLSRVVYSQITPADSQGEYFSIYTTFERAASVVGPLVWLLTFYLLKVFGENIQYRGSVLLLVVICFLGLYFVKKSEKYS